MKTDRRRRRHGGVWKMVALGGRAGGACGVGAALLWAGVGAGVAQPLEPEEQLIEQAGEGEGGGDEAWAELEALLADQPAIESYRAEFTQQKFSPLLMDPIESRGRVRVSQGVSRWDTDSPHASTMLIEGGELKLYYPEQSTLEVYDLGDRLESMAASPVLEVGVLQEYFTLASARRDAEAGRLELVLLPRQEQMAESLEQVVVSVALAGEAVESASEGGADATSEGVVEDGGVAAGAGALRRLEMTDLDGETTVLEFHEIRLNPRIEAQSLKLELPEGTTVVRPVEGGE